MNPQNPSASHFILPYRTSVLALLFAGTFGITAARADSPTEIFITPNTSLLKGGSGGNWETSSGAAGAAVPVAGVTGTIAEGASANPLGWNNNTNPGASSIGDLDFISGSTTLVVGDYYSKTTSPSNAAVNITLLGSTLNSQANTVLANSSGNTIVFENDVAPSGDYLAETGTTTFTLGNTTNVIQSTSNSNIIIDNVVTGTGDSLTFLGGGKSGTTGATLELGAGSANDVTGGVAANAPTKANGGTFTSTATVQTTDKNSFTGGLTIGDVGGTANAGVVKVDGANALPTTGAITVNANSQLLLNGAASYGSATQNLILNGTGTATTNGALTTTSGNVSTWQGTVDLASTSSVNVQGTTGSLAASGAISGAGQLQNTGTGTLFLTGANTYQGGTSVSTGTVYANTAIVGTNSATGTGAVSVAGGAKLGGSGVIRPTTSGAGITLLANSTLISGGIQTGTTAGAGLTLDNTQADGKILDASAGNVDLVFSLGAGGTANTTGYNFADPNTHSSFMTVLGATAGELSFATGDTFTLNDLTGGHLELGSATPYVLIDASSDSDYAGLITTGMTAGGPIENGFVTNLTVNGSVGGEPVLYLDNGMLEAVPEPGTWALMAGGLVALAAWFRIRKSERLE